MRNRRAFRPGLLGLVALVVAALSSCAIPSPVISETVYEAVRADDRERNYDLAWQEIRMLNAHLEAENSEGVREKIDWVLARMHRLEQGRASRLGDIFTARSMAISAERASERGRKANQAMMGELGQQVQDYFDAGDFSAAKKAARELYVLAYLPWGPAGG